MNKQIEYDIINYLYINYEIKNYGSCHKWLSLTYLRQIDSSLPFNLRSRNEGDRAVIIVERSSKSSFYLFYWN